MERTILSIVAICLIVGTLCENVSARKGSGGSSRGGSGGSGGTKTTQPPPPPPPPPYPIPLQPGIWPPESPGTNLGYSAPRGATGATAWAFIQSNIFDLRDATVDIDHLRVYALVNGATVMISNDDYGTDPGQQQNVPGDWTPRANYTDPTLEIPGVIADSWSPTYFTTNSAKDLNYGMQIWNAVPGTLPRGTTKVWAEIVVRVNGSGLVCFGYDWYGANGYIGNAGYSGFQIYLTSTGTPTWQTVTIGK